MPINYNLLHTNIAQELNVDERVAVYARKRLIDKEHYPDTVVLAKKVQDKVNTLKNPTLSRLKDAIARRELNAKKKPIHAEKQAKKIEKINFDVKNVEAQINFLEKVLRFVKTLTEEQQAVLTRAPKEEELV